MHQNSLWTTMLLAVVLLLFAAIGVACVINPDWLIKRSPGMRKGGEMLTEWNRTQAQDFGVIFAGCAIYGLYVLLRTCAGH